RGGRGLGEGEGGWGGLEERGEAPPRAAKPSAYPAPQSPAPERTVDPNVHASILTNLHKATIDSENNGRHFLQILEKEVEPAIKELSSVLLYPDGPTNELDLCVQKFEEAISSMRSAQQELQGSIERVRNFGDELLKG